MKEQSAAGILEATIEKVKNLVSVSTIIGEPMQVDGGITAEGSCREVLIDNSFYTTAANRMSRSFFVNAVTARDVVELLRENRGGQR